jgi:hypothetical protein
VNLVAFEKTESRFQTGAFEIWNPQAHFGCGRTPRSAVFGNENALFDLA